ncbi:MAG TPA: PAS domain S-box protein, partial [Thermoanaerobaculia bacterium]|nr:PAS domain S-box protein [Thermoanaerobaculia bacterium]
MTESETLRRRIRELEREIEETRSNLAEEQAANQALQAGQVDAIVDRSGGGALLLQAAQAALRASEEQLRAMFHLAPVGVAQADPATGRWLAVNPRMCLITGYSEAELLKMRIPEITHAEDRQ